VLLLIGFSCHGHRLVLHLSHGLEHWIIFGVDSRTTAGARAMGIRQWLFYFGLALSFAVMRRSHASCGPAVKGNRNLATEDRDEAGRSDDRGADEASNDVMVGSWHRKSREMATFKGGLGYGMVISLSPGFFYS